uniref:Uncharacterized protein n=1 Tax=Cannabis sativa TaxID=3483 RepID=A0A803QT79_CANSA
MEILCLSNTYNQRREEKVSPARKFYQNGVDFVQPQAAKPAEMGVNYWVEDELITGGSSKQNVGVWQPPETSTKHKR